MTSGIFALIGVLLGGTVTGTVTWNLERLREKATRRATSRLVLEELARNYARVASVRRFGGDVRGVLSEIDGPVWLEHRALLARSLDDQDWARATTAWMWLDAASTFGADHGPLTDVQAATVAAAAESTEAAIKALGVHALPKQPKGSPLDLDAARELLDLQPDD